MTADSPSVDDLVFQYLEAYDESPEVASALLGTLKDSTADQGQELEEAIGRLEEIGLLQFPKAKEWTIGGYRILRRIARGGMGEVYLAVGDGEQSRVALKLLRRELRNDEGARARFAQEVAALQSVDHPSVAQILDHGEQDGLPFIVSEYVEGATLQAVIESIKDLDPAELAGADVWRVPMDVGDGAPSDGCPEDIRGTASFEEEVAKVAREVARALAHTHSRGLVHRDVKPANIILTPTGRVVLVDFGLAATAATDRLTASSQRVGSLPYMSPESLQDGGPPNPASDVYSLGITAHELLARRLPFEANHPDRLAVEIVLGKTRSLRKDLPSIAEGLLLAVDCAMDPSLSRRYATVEAFASDLTEFLEGRNVRVRPLGTRQSVARWAKQHPVLATALVSGLLLLVSGPLTYGFMQRAHSRETDALNESLTAAFVAMERSDSDAKAAANKALESIRTQLIRLATVDLENIPGGAKVRRQVLHDAVRLLAELPVIPDLEETRDELDLLLEQGLIEFEGEDGDIVGALRRIEAVVVRLRAKHEAAPSNAELAYRVGAATLEHARCLSNVGRADEAVTLLPEFLQFSKAGLSAGYLPESLQVDLAQQTNLRAMIHLKVRDFERAETLARWVVQSAPSIPKADRDRSTVRIALAKSHTVLARLARFREDENSALAHSLDACKVLRSVVEDYPHHRAALLELAETIRGTIIPHVARGENNEATEALDEATRAYEKLAVDYPDWSMPKMRLTDAIGLRAEIAANSGDAAEAVRLQKMSIAAWGAFTADERIAMRGRVAAISNLARMTVRFDPEDRAQLAVAESFLSEAIDVQYHHQERFFRRGDAVLVPYYRSTVRSLLGDLQGAKDDIDRMVEVAGGADVLAVRDERYIARAWEQIWVRATALGDASEVDAAVAKEQLYLSLERAVALGFRELGALTSSENFAALAGEARFVNLLTSMERAPEEE